MKNANALIIIAKLPEQELVKTRLAGHISDEKRVELYEYLLNNTIQRLGRIPEVDTFIAFAPEDAELYFSRFGLKLIPLPEGDLGARMFYALNEVLKEDYQKAALVGVDIPELTGSIVLRAFELLQDSDVVFGPAKDGGYYLVGIKSPVREIFEHVQWSTDKTLSQSIKIARQFGYSVALTETLSDVDTIEDVKKAGLNF